MSIKRIFGLETEFGVAFNGERGSNLSAEEVSRYLFRKVVSWGRSSNVFLKNGSRLYLDVGSHPEYATAECLDIRQLIAFDKGGERVMEGLIQEAQHRLAHEGIKGGIHLFKNNVDSHGNSYGCHENYLVHRQADFRRLSNILVPFLITRQIITGAGYISKTSQGAEYNFSQRAEHIWEATSSATTRARPIINTRDEPHADAEYYRRLHVIVGDSSMAEPTIMFKVGATDLLLRCIEAGFPMSDYSIENPMDAIREISKDLSGKHKFRLHNGTELTAVELQRIYFEKVATTAPKIGDLSESDNQVLDLWERTLDCFDKQDFTAVNRELDWVIKRDLLQRYSEKWDLSLADAKIQRLDLSYHDVSRTTGLYNLLSERGYVKRITTDIEILESTAVAPQNTRAKLRGQFVTKALETGKDYTVDWVHLKLNDISQRTVLCKDPFKFEDERVEQLLETM